jgi:hypothetical protein
MVDPGSPLALHDVKHYTRQSSAPTDDPGRARDARDPLRPTDVERDVVDQQRHARQRNRYGAPSHPSDPSLPAGETQEANKVRMVRR